MLPTRSSSDETTGSERGGVEPPAIAGKQDHRLARSDLGVEAVERAYVLAAEVDVDERRDLAVAEDLRAERRIPLDEVLEHCADRGTLGLDLALAADLGAQSGWDADGRHACTGP